MKKIVLLISLLLLISCQSGETSNSYANADYGIKFSYPDNDIRVDDKVSDLDKGKRVSISTSGFSMVLTSEDYEPGVNEGCCYYFSGKSVDLKSAQADIEKQFGSVYDFQIVNVSGKDGFQFIRFNKYVSVMPVLSLLVPVSGHGFSNILISGPTLGNFVKDDKPDEAAAFDYINNKQYEEDEEYKNNLVRFQSVISSIKLN